MHHQIPPQAIPGNGGRIKEPKNDYYSIVGFTSFWGGLTNIVSGLFMHPFFCYIARSIKWDEPSVWASVGGVFFVRLLIMAAGAVKPFARQAD